jgi:hypothetical protein
LVQEPPYPMPSWFLKPKIKEGFKTNADGNFEEDLSWLLCENFDTYKIFAYNEATGEASEILIKNVDDAQPSLLDVCDVGCAFTGSINYNCDKLGCCRSQQWQWQLHLQMEQWSKQLPLFN